MKATNKSVWTVLPAALVLFGKNKVNLKELAIQFPEGTVVFCKKPNGQTGFIYGSSGSYGKPGDKFIAKHDQTGGQIGAGEWEVIKELSYTIVNGELVSNLSHIDEAGNAVFEPVSAVDLKINATLAVFK